MSPYFPPSESWKINATDGLQKMIMMHMDLFLDLRIYVKVFSDIQRTLITALRGWLVQMETEEILDACLLWWKPIRNLLHIIFKRCQFMSIHSSANMLECVSIHAFDGSTRPSRGVFSRPKIFPSQLKGDFGRKSAWNLPFFPVIWGFLMIRLMDVDGQNLASILHVLLDSKSIKLPKCQKKDFI